MITNVLDLRVLLGGYFTLKYTEVRLSLCLSSTTWIRRGCGDKASQILDLGTEWRQVITFTHRPLYQRKEPSVRVVRKLDGGGSERFGEGQNTRLSQEMNSSAPGLSACVY